MPSPGVIQVTAGVLVRGDTVLVCQRRPGGHHPRKWEFPGGKVEAGESLEEALRRELREELGIDAQVGRVLWHTQHHYRGRAPITLTFFAIAQYTGTLANCCFAAIRWAPVGMLHEIDFLAADREFIGQLVSGQIRLD
jgi:8-oxo-dGTP diphosphatase